MGRCWRSDFPSRIWSRNRQHLREICADSTAQRLAHHIRPSAEYNESHSSIPRSMISSMYIFYLLYIIIVSLVARLLITEIIVVERRDINEFFAEPLDAIARSLLDGYRLHSLIALSLLSSYSQSHLLYPPLFSPPFSFSSLDSPIYTLFHSLSTSSFDSSFHSNTHILQKNLLGFTALWFILLTHDNIFFFMPSRVFSYHVSQQNCPPLALLHSFVPSMGSHSSPFIPSLQSKSCLGIRSPFITQWITSLYSISSLHSSWSLFIHSHCQHSHCSSSVSITPQLVSSLSLLYFVCLVALNSFHFHIRFLSSSSVSSLSFSID